MKNYGILVLLGLLGGCATATTVAHGPNGRPLQHIESISAAKAYSKASEKCPNGYDLLTWHQQGAITLLDVECR